MYLSRLNIPRLLWYSYLMPSPPGSEFSPSENGDSNASFFVCSWCRTPIGIRSVAEPARINYGICKSCLQPALSRLEDSASDRPAPHSVRRSGNRSFSAEG